MDDINLYDEFGNYIGPDLNEVSKLAYNYQFQQNDDDEMHDIDQSELDMEQATYQLAKVSIPQQNSIVLNEDKQYYPDAKDIYGKSVETMVQEEDTQPISEPILAPMKARQFEFEEKHVECTFDFNFLAALQGNQQLIRSVAFVGQLHSGKTTLMDLFVKQTHVREWPLDRDVKFTDTRVDEQDRLISIKSTPMSLVVPNSRGKHYLLNLYDTPGHVNFADEACVAMRVSDGVVIVVDVVDGVTMYVEKLIRYAVEQNVKIIVLLNKLDRLVLELKLPPSDAYLKLKHTLEEVNVVIMQASRGRAEVSKVSPQLGNVVFGSGYYQFVFTVGSFAKNYADQYGIPVDTFSKILWGDYYFDQASRKFTKSPNKSGNKRTFVEFILEPFYKICSHVVSKEKDQLEPFLATIGVYLKKHEYKIDIKPLLKLVMHRYFGDTSPLVDVIVSHIPDSKTGAQLKLSQYYVGDKDQTYDQVLKADPSGPLVINIVKLYNKADCLSFDAFGRVLSGTIRTNQVVKDEEDMTMKTAKTLWVYEGRYRVETPVVPAGNWVLIEGIDQSITKSATIVGVNDRFEILRPVKQLTLATMKVAIEPLVPSELPKMLEALRKINKSYPLLTTKVEESGEHIILGTGELALDCALHDLRRMYSEIEIKVSDPSVRFCETVIDTSSRMCYADSPNKKNRITMTAQPLDKGLADEIEREHVSLSWERPQVQKFFQEQFDWDILAARSVWAFGPDMSNGPNIIQDDSLPSQTNKSLLGSVRESIVQGFQWATREGPLCDEPIRNVKFKIIDASIAEEPIHRGGGQIIPTSRRTCYSSFLMATPRIMEPMLLAEIQCTADSLNAIYNVLMRRRGHVLSETAKPGSPLYVVRANIPTIDHFGFESDLRVHTSGQAYVLTIFDHWSLLPGDPLDKTIKLKPLEPSPPPHLAREFMVKTRRRKGLNEDVSILKYFDDQALIEALKQDRDYQQFI